MKRISRIIIAYIAIFVTQALMLSSVAFICNTGCGPESCTAPKCAAVCFAATGGLDKLGQAAGELVSSLDETAEYCINPPITRREVFRIRPGKKISKKEIRRRGGSGRYFQIYKIRKGDRVYKQIAGRSFKPGGAMKLSDLRYIRTLYYDFKGSIRSGEIIVNKAIAEDTAAVFRDLYKARYQIRKMQLVDNYFPSAAGSGNGKKSEAEPVWTAAAAEAADTASMNDDNTSGFNYRMVAGTSGISMHGYGRAIDVNPFENPWCPGGVVYRNQRASVSYANRGNVRDHMIYADSKITKIFKKHGFRWLGETATRDYQHFEK